MQFVFPDSGDSLRRAGRLRGKKRSGPAAAQEPTPTITPAPTAVPTPTRTPEPTPEPTPSINLSAFPFLEHTFCLDLITDDPEAEGADILKTYTEEHTASGRFVLLVFSVVDGEVPLEQIKEQYYFIALTGGGDGYSSLGYNVFNIGFDAENISFYQADMQTDSGASSMFHPIWR